MDFLAVIRQESDRFYDTADHADPTRPVPSCPEWTIADLTWHLAEVHWFWATDVEQRATSPDSVEAAKPPRPSDHASVVAFGRSQVDHLLGALEATADDVAVWTWSPPHQTVGFIRRHQVQEAAVHRWDLEHAAGIAAPHEIDAAAASDSIDELLEVTLPWSVSAERPLAGTTHLHCTDVDGEWLVQADGRVERQHAKGDVALRGPASALLLALYKRTGLDTVEVIGDADVAAGLVQRIGTE